MFFRHDQVTVTVFVLYYSLVSVQNFYVHILAMTTETKWPGITHCTKREVRNYFRKVLQKQRTISQRRRRWSCLPNDEKDAQTQQHNRIHHLVNVFAIASRSRDNHFGRHVEGQSELVTRPLLIIPAAENWVMKNCSLGEGAST